MEFERRHKSVDIYIYIYNKRRDSSVSVMMSNLEIGSACATQDVMALVGETSLSVRPISQLFSQNRHFAVVL